MAKWKRGGYFAVIGTAIVVYAIFFGYYTRTKTFWLTYFPDNSYQPASNLPNVDGQGQPKVVMVRRSLRGHPKPANEGHLKTGQRE